MNILISGCSYSHDSGFKNPTGKVWHSHIPTQHVVKNLSLRGQSNYKIFSKACAELLVNQHHYDLVVIQWTTLHRLSLNDGHSIYDNPVNLTLSDIKNRSKFHQLWTKSFIHPRVELLEFLTLVSTMAVFLNSMNINYAFVKGFDNHLSNLQYKHWVSCDDSFKDLVLYKDHLPDWEVDSFYQSLRNQYLSMLSVSKNHWVNLNQADWFKNIVDLADDGIHAGILSNKNFYNQINDFVNQYKLVL